VAHAYVSVTLVNLAHIEDGIERGMRALAAAKSLKDPGVELLATYALGLGYMFLGAHSEAIEFFQRNVGLGLEAIPPLRTVQRAPGLLYRAFTAAPYSYCETNTGYCLAELGEFQKALEHCARAVKVAEDYNLGFVRANADAFLGFVYLRRGDLDLAIQVMGRCLKAYTNADLPFGHLLLARALGAAYNLCGRIAEAIEVLEQAWNFAEPRKHFVWGQPVLAHLGDAYGRVGRIDEAVSTALRALEISRQYAGRGNEAWTLYLLGNIYTYPNPPNLRQARDAYGEALALAQALGMRPLEGQCHLALGTLDTHARRVVEAGSHLAMATTMFREMRMQLWLEKAQSALKAG
jgi:tetratricopeptide (TPR) repeat protein